MALEGFLRSLVAERAFNGFAILPLRQGKRFSYYKNWVAQGKNGELKYLANHLAAKENPLTLWPNFASLIVLSKNYRPHPRAAEDPLPSLPKAYYSQGQDYHQWLKNELQIVCDHLTTILPGETFLPGTDSIPLMERDYAEQGGLGWIGKNTMLIDRTHGSFFFICEILTTYKRVDLSSQSIGTGEAAVHDFCGKCDRCERACPTGALANRSLDATKCISTWTIESRSVAKKSLWTKFGSEFFGCDICQNVCPWNQKIFGKVRDRDSAVPGELNSTTEKDSKSEQILTPEALASLRWILKASNQEIQRRIHGSPLARAGSFGLRRNALYLIGNLRVQVLKESVERFRNHLKLGTLADEVLAILTDSTNISSKKNRPTSCEPTD